MHVSRGRERLKLSHTFVDEIVSPSRPKSLWSRVEICVPQLVLLGQLRGIHGELTFDVLTLSTVYTIN